MTDYITLPRATVQQALEAIDLYQRNEHCEDELLIAGHFLRAALAEPEQEPVAMRYDFDGYGYQYIDNGSGSNWRERHKDAEPLYTTPPQRKPLPKGEWPKHKSPYVKDEYIGYAKSDLDDYAMQVLAAHGIKEGT